MLSGQGGWEGDGKIDFSSLYPCFFAHVFAGTDGSLFKASQEKLRTVVFLR